MRIGFEVLTAVVMKSTIFWDITPCSSLSVNRCFGGTYRLHLQGRRISRARNQRESRSHPLNLFSTLTMETICSSETSVDTQRTTRRYVPKDGTLHVRMLTGLFCLFIMSIGGLFEHGNVALRVNKRFLYSKINVTDKFSTPLLTVIWIVSRLCYTAENIFWAYSQIFLQIVF
jgi:hypothetical protein